MRRPLAYFTRQIDYDSLLSDLKQMLDNVEEVKKEVTATYGDSYIMRINPYSTTSGAIEGLISPL